MTKISMDVQEITKRMLEGNIRTKKSILNSPESLECLEEIVQTLIYTLNDGNKILTMGNGGSACDALHFSSELVGRYSSNRGSLPAICLNSDFANITCIANDFGYERIFSRQLESLAQEGDAVIGYSTSGNSQNIINGFETAREKGVTAIGFCGTPPGQFPEFTDYLFKVPTNKGAHIQETHAALTHIICEALEEQFSTEEN